MIYDPEVVRLRKEMLVNEMQTPFLRRGAFLVTVFDEASISLLTFGLQGFSERIVILINMQSQKVSSREILAA